VPDPQLSVQLLKRLPGRQSWELTVWELPEFGQEEIGEAAALRKAG